jgi:hypothetical protein
LAKVSPASGERFAAGQKSLRHPENDFPPGKSLSGIRITFPRLEKLIRSCRKNFHRKKRGKPRYFALFHASVTFDATIETFEAMKKKQSKSGRQLQKKSPYNDIKRVHRVVFMLNDTEHNAIARYLQKYKITNKSNWYRKTILSHIWRVMEEDYPTLFNENEMRR